MTLEEILDGWAKDSRIDRSELGKEAAACQSLHHKYLQNYIHEKLLLKQQEQEYRKAQFRVTNYYIEGPSKETAAWRDPKNFPAKGKILRNDAPKYVEVDPDISDLSMKLEYARAKVEALENILKQVGNRGFLIKDAIQWTRFIGGEG